jgi:uncharacterized integral membrane protein
VKFLKLLVLIVLCVCILGAGLMFALFNTDKITLDFVFFKTPEASIGIWLVFAAIFGTLIGFFINSLTIWALKTRLRSKSRRLDVANRELDELRSPAKEAQPKKELQTQAAFG